jgi:hypothetical protein
MIDDVLTDLGDRCLGTDQPNQEVNTKSFIYSINEGLRLWI